MNLVFTNNYRDSVVERVAAQLNKPVGAITLREYYDSVKEFTIDKRNEYLDLEFEESRRRIFKDTDQLLQANSGKDMYIHLGNHYSVVERYPLANIIMVDYNPSLLFAEFANNPGVFSRWTIVDYVWAYCKLKQWLDAKGIKYTHLRNDVELGELRKTSALAMVDSMNEQLEKFEYGSWDESGKVKAFELLDYPKLSSTDVVRFFG